MKHIKRQLSSSISHGINKGFYFFLHDLFQEIYFLNIILIFIMNYQFKYIFKRKTVTCEQKGLRKACTYDHVRCSLVDTTEKMGKNLC